MFSLLLACSVKNKNDTAETAETPISSTQEEMGLIDIAATPKRVATDSLYSLSTAVRNDALGYTAWLDQLTLNFSGIRFSGDENYDIALSQLDLDGSDRDGASSRLAQADIPMYETYDSATIDLTANPCSVEVSGTWQKDDSETVSDFDICVSDNLSFTSPAYFADYDGDNIFLVPHPYSASEHGGRLMLDISTFYDADSRNYIDDAAGEYVTIPGLLHDVSLEATQDEQADQITENLSNGSIMPLSIELPE